MKAQNFVAFEIPQIDVLIDYFEASAYIAFRASGIPNRSKFRYVDLGEQSRMALRIPPFFILGIFLFVRCTAHGQKSD